MTEKRKPAFELYQHAGFFMYSLRLYQCDLTIGVNDGGLSFLLLGSYGLYNHYS